MAKANFNLAQLFMTRAVNDRMAQDEGFSKFVYDSLKRHASGDWGDLCQEDIKENELSLEEGFRLLTTPCSLPLYNTALSLPPASRN